MYRLDELQKEYATKYMIDTEVNIIRGLKFSLADKSNRRGWKTQVIQLNAYTTEQ